MEGHRRCPGLARREVRDARRAGRGGGGGLLPFDPSAEAYTRRAIGELRKEWVHFVDDPWTDLDEIRGHLLSIDQLRPRLRRLRSSTAAASPTSMPSAVKPTMAA
jgi:hypothetical protein